MSQQPATDSEQPPDPATGPLRGLREELAESPPLWWALLYFFSLLCGYYVLRPVRDAMAASNDVAAVFPDAWIAWALSHGFELKDFVLQALFTGTFGEQLASIGAGAPAAA